MNVGEFISVKPLCIRQMVTMKANLKELSHLQIFTSELAEPGVELVLVSEVAALLFCAMKGLAKSGPHGILAEGLGRHSQDRLRSPEAWTQDCVWNLGLHSSVYSLSGLIGQEDPSQAVMLEASSQGLHPTHFT